MPESAHRSCGQRNLAAAHWAVVGARDDPTAADDEPLNGSNVENRGRSTLFKLKQLSEW